MKKNNLFLFLLFLSFSIESKSQDLTFLDLKYLLEHNVESSDTFISQKNFIYHKVKKGENLECDVMIWSYDRNINNNKATAFLAKCCYQANEGFIWYQFSNKKTFDKIKEYCKSIGFTLSKTETSVLNKLCITFENKNYNIEFCSGLNDETNINDYTITLKKITN